MKKLMIAVLGLGLAGALWADSSYSFTYQAALRDEHGNIIRKDDAVVRNHSVSLRLWDRPSGGTLLWGRVFNIITDETGLFNLEVTDDGGELPTETPAYASLEQVFLAQGAGDVYVGLEVKDSAGEIVPRQRLFSVPFAAVANDVRKISKDVAVGGSITMGAGGVVMSKDGIVQTSGSSTFQDVAVNGSLKAGQVVASNGLVVNGGTVTVRTDLAVTNGKLFAGGAEVVPVPVGGIIMWTSQNLPDNEHWAVCDGSQRNGVWTPDLRGRFIVGVGQQAGTSYRYNTGDTGGSAKHTLSVNEMPSHQHSYSFKGGDIKGGWDSDNYFYDASGHYPQNGNTRYTDAAGGSQPHENRPPYYALYYIMRIK